MEFPQCVRIPRDVSCIEITRRPTLGNAASRSRFLSLRGEAFEKKCTLAFGKCSAIHDAISNMRLSRNGSLTRHRVISNGTVEGMSRQSLRIFWSKASLIMVPLRSSVGYGQRIRTWRCKARESQSRHRGGSACTGRPEIPSDSRCTSLPNPGSSTSSSVYAKRNFSRHGPFHSAFNQIPWKFTQEASCELS